MKFMEIHSNDVLSHWAVEQLDLLYTARQHSLPGKMQPESKTLQNSYHSVYFLNLGILCLLNESKPLCFGHYT